MPPARLELDMALVESLYASDWSLAKIGRHLGCSAQHVKNCMRRAGIATRQHDFYDWQNVILPRAAEIVRSYDTGVTLRQLFYRLVSEQLIRNEQTAYSMLSTKSAAWRREDRFPDLIDTTRSINRYKSFESPEEALQRAARTYQRDGQETQDYCVRIAVEKRGIVEQMDAWFTEPFDIPIIPTGGYVSQSFVKIVQQDLDDRLAVLLYGGDLDPSGVDIYRDFVERTGGDATWHVVEHVALKIAHVDEYDLAVLDAKEDDTRADGFVAQYAELFPDEADDLDEFVAEHGDIFQVELDALDPDVLRQLFEDALADYVDEDKVDAVRELENEERERLRSATLSP